MAFGQATGPAASGRKLNELLELLQEAGHSDFRDARGPMGFTQRQAAGKFTVGEADEFIGQLHEAQHRGEFAETSTSVEIPPEALESLKGVPDAVLAAELQSRGWVVMEP